MSAKILALIEFLSKSDMIVQCLHCRDKFKMSDFILFDGRKEFPLQVQKARQEMLQDLQLRRSSLSRRHSSAQDSEWRSASIGLGKIIEKILPAHRSFEFKPSDCRFLSEPIDMIVFEGLTEDKIEKITFLDVKTGGSSLNRHQKQVKDAVISHRVECESF